MIQDKNNKNEVKQISLEDVFRGRRFYIPNYQRGYSWETKQRKQLFEDILSLKSLSESKEYKHYMGTIVALEPKNDKCDSRYAIVDGQQRLTSLVLLVHCLLQRNDFKEELRDKTVNTFIDRDNSEIFRSGLQEKILCSVLAGDLNNKAQRDNELNNNSLLKQDRNLITALNDFDEMIDNAVNNGLTTNDINELVTNKLGFIFFVPRVDAVAGRMFEVINNRGKELSELDKIKNYLVYLAELKKHENFKRSIERSWKDVLENIQRAGFETIGEENEFLRACWITFNPYNKQESQAVYDSLKSTVDKSINGLEVALKFYNFLLAASKDLFSLFSTKEEKGKSDEQIVIYERLSQQLRIN